jgi:hypothetical protein
MKAIILQCYAPANIAGLEDKENFYEQIYPSLKKQA